MTPFILESGFLSLLLLAAELEICDELPLGRSLLSSSVTFGGQTMSPNLGSFKYGSEVSRRDYVGLNMGFVLCLFRFPHIVV